MHSLSPTPRQTLRCQVKLNTNIPKWLSHRAGSFRSSMLFHVTRASKSPCPKGPMNATAETKILIVKRQLHLKTSELPLAVAGGWTRQAHLWAQMEAAGDKWGGGCHFPVGPSTICHLVSGWLLFDSLPIQYHHHQLTSKDSSYVYKCIKNCMCIRVCGTYLVPGY